MSTQPRLPSAIPDQPQNFATVTAHAPDLMQRFFDLYAHFWNDDVVGAEIKEMTRLRNARITDCGY